MQWRPGPQRPGKPYVPYVPQQRPCPECACPNGKCKGKGKGTGKQQPSGQSAQQPAKPWGGQQTMPVAQPSVQQQQQQPVSPVTTATQRWVAWWRQQQAGKQAVGQAKTASRKCLTKKAGQSC